MRVHTRSVIAEKIPFFSKLQVFNTVAVALSFILDTQKYFILKPKFFHSISLSPPRQRQILVEYGWSNEHFLIVITGWEVLSDPP